MAMAYNAVSAYDIFWFVSHTVIDTAVFWVVWQRNEWGNRLDVL